MTMKLNNYPVKVGRISYINVDPIYFGIDRNMKPDWMDLVSAPPSTLNQMMADGEIVISPVSSVEYARNMKDWMVIPDLSISCNGKVLSVLLVSRLPIDELNGKKVVLTDESATSADLTRLIFSKKNIRPQIIKGSVKKLEDIDSETDAALVIGDSALTQPWKQEFEYVTDLGELWKNLTGLPFVFALWVVNRKFAENNPEIVSKVHSIFIDSRAYGYSNIEGIKQAATDKIGIGPDLSGEYYKHLGCELTPNDISGLQTFYDGLHKINILDEKVQLSFFNPQPAVLNKLQAS